MKQTRNVIKNKKAISNEIVIGLLTTLITFIILILFITNYVESYRYQDSLISCNLFLKGVEGKPAYFNNSLSTPSAKLENSLKTLCSSKSIQIQEKNMQPAVELMKNCYNKVNEGDNFLGANVENYNLCLYCGRIESDEEINFKQEMDKYFEKYPLMQEYFFKKDKETINYNDQTLTIGLPETLSKDKSVEVYYRIDKGEAKGVTDRIFTWLSTKLGGINSQTGFLNSIFADSSRIETFSAIVLYNEGLEQTSSSSTTGKTTAATESTTQTFDKNDCYYIIPDKNFD